MSVTEQSNKPEVNTGNTSGMSVTSSAVSVGIKQTDSKNLEGSFAGTDTRKQAAQPKMPPQPAPRAETSDELEGVGG